MSPLPAPSQVRLEEFVNFFRDYFSLFVERGLLQSTESVSLEDPPLVSQLWRSALRISRPQCSSRIRQLSLALLDTDLHPRCRESARERPGQGSTVDQPSSGSLNEEKLGTAYSGTLPAVTAAGAVRAHALFEARCCRSICATGSVFAVFARVVRSLLFCAPGKAAPGEAAPGT